MKETKTATLGDFLTPGEIERVIARYRLIDDREPRFVEWIEREITRPNIERINGALGQENDPKYLAYMICFAAQRGI